MSKIDRIYISLKDIGAAKDRIHVEYEPYGFDLKINSYNLKNLR